MNLIRSQSRLVTFSGKLLSRGRVQTLTTANTNEKHILEPLIEREIIRVKGEEVVPFLQGLITNDIKHLHPSSNKAIYAMFLNKAGRVMYDVILYSTPEATKFFIECDKTITLDLQRHLKLYRVRRKIDIDSLEHELKVWQAFEPNKQSQNLMNTINKEEVNNLTITIDPRLKSLGTRILARSDKNFTDICKVFEDQEFSEASDKNNYQLHRYSLGIAEGVTEMPPGKCFPLEANCDILNGVSFHKGCYIGQELTARVHHTGMIRKRHMPVKLSAPLHCSSNSSTVQNEAGANCGIIYGTLANYALGLLRVENVLKAKKLLVNGNECFTEKPPWWPTELYSSTLTKCRQDI